MADVFVLTAQKQHALTETSSGKAPNPEKTPLSASQARRDHAQAQAAGNNQTYQVVVALVPVLRRVRQVGRVLAHDLSEALEPIGPGGKKNRADSGQKCLSCLGIGV